MGELRALRPHVAAAELGADWWETAARVADSTAAGTTEPSALHDLAAELVATLRALEDLTATLAHHAEAQAERTDLRDDDGGDPRIRLRHAATDARGAERLLRTTQQTVNAFRSALAHLGLAPDPTDHHKRAAEPSPQARSRRGAAMNHDGTTAERAPAPPPDESRLVYRTELIRAEVAAGLAIDLGDVPGGGPVRWELSIDAARVACTDELLTDEAAISWARRMLGEGVTFLPGTDTGGYWVAGPTCDIATCLTPATRRTPADSRGGRDGLDCSARPGGPGAGVWS